MRRRYLRMAFTPGDQQIRARWVLTGTVGFIGQYKGIRRHDHLVITEVRRVVEHLTGARLSVDRGLHHAVHPMVVVPSIFGTSTASTVTHRSAVEGDLAAVLTRLGDRNRLVGLHRDHDEAVALALPETAAMFPSVPLGTNCPAANCAQSAGENVNPREASGRRGTWDRCPSEEPL